MRASGIMTRTVITVHTHTPVKQAAALLAEHAITAMPVFDDDDRLVGMVSEADVLANRIAPDPRSHPRRDAEHPDPAHSVGELMTVPVVAMASSTDTADTADLMLQYNVRSIPIVEGATVVGIVSRRDLLRTLIRDDDAIAAELRSRLEYYSGHRSHWQVRVRDGVVTIGGHFDDDTERRVVTALASTVPGVSNVHTDHRLLHYDRTN
jgi:CBS domain-containing protein